MLSEKRALLNVGGVDEHVGLTGCDDYDLIWTMLERGATVHVLERPLYNYRDHGEERLTLRSREAQIRHTLLDELADAQLGDTRKDPPALGVYRQSARYSQR